MAEITTVIWNSYSHDNIAQIPADVLLMISEEELLDRLDAAAELDDKAANAPVNDLAVGYNERRRELLAARPRDEIEDRVLDLAQKADMMTDPTHRAALKERIRDLQKQNPAAPVRPRAPKTAAPAGAAPATGIRAEYEAQIRELIKAEMAEQRDRLTALQAQQDQVAAGVANVKAQKDMLLKNQAAYGALQTPDMVKSASRSQKATVVGFDKTRGFGGR